MDIRFVTISTSALPGRPERPFKYAEPVTASDGTVGYNRPLENYFDASMASRLLPAKSPTMLYDTIAHAHDHQFQVSPDMVDPSWSTPRPLILNPKERRRSLAKVIGNSPEYMGISPDAPEWRPRRSSYEDRRGAVGVTPSEINTLIPYIPPIDTSLPPPSKEWLDAKAKQILAEAHADFERSQSKLKNDSVEPEPSKADDEDDFFEYDTDSSLDKRVTVPRAPAPQPPQAELESNPYDNDPWNVDTDTDTDTDTDMDSDDGYNYSMTHISESSPRPLSDVPQWIIPRKRPSVVIVDDKVTTNVNAPSSDDERAGKRPSDAKREAWRRIAKTPKRHANDSPARRGNKSSGYEPGEDTSSDPASSPARATIPSRPSVTAAALQMKQVRIASPTRTLPPARNASVLPKSAKVFPCRLNGCTHVCASAGDLQRHQLSLRHRSPSHVCLACGKSYTRSDALKRHLKSKAACKKLHATKLAKGAEGPADTSTEAV